MHRASDLGDIELDLIEADALRLDLLGRANPDSLHRACNPFLVLDYMLSRGQWGRARLGPGRASVVTAKAAALERALGRKPLLGA